ncbi:aliphatic sulfonate ABC transporter substrate-binding protein [Streptomyces sp. PKU-MA01144]|uniref:aliphatic sulfonate ABC transporter substrate-binding protein n=1 Tax=Streptomyces sp. PKU-MA01144 TaxID=2729138 RepID=UPI001480BAE5|nr:aliphatic sulfonate ABC transporter substrate-binding protein [Streptomyces sp. PKU-MA01144]NNJ05642.1 aliphatic sulfonate ABC transporter substrate-binding protein [Streptomyces sp. PKU-MA01144]
MPAARTTFRRRLSAAAVLPLFAVVLTACGYGAEAPKDDEIAPVVGGKKLSVDEVRLGYFPNLTHATALIGVQDGHIQRELGGTALKTSTFSAGPSAIEALNAGSIDIGFVGPSPSVNGFTKSNGRNLRVIGGSASGGVKLVVDPEKIRTLDDLKGKRIATPQKGNTQDVALINWINGKGWKVDTESGEGDVFVVRSDNKVTPDAFASGSIDGAWVPEPTASKLVTLGGRVLLDETALWPEKKFVITHIVVSQTFLKEHPDAVEAVLRGTVKTNAWINANPGEAKASANKALEKLSGKPLPAEVLDPAWPSIRITDDPLAETLKTQSEWAVESKLLPKADLDGIYDLKLLNKVLEAEGRPEVSAAGLGVK